MPVSDSGLKHLKTSFGGQNFNRLYMADTSYQGTVLLGPDGVRCREVTLYLVSKVFALIQ